MSFGDWAWKTFFNTPLVVMWEWVAEDGVTTRSPAWRWDPPPEPHALRTSKGLAFGDDEE